MNGVGRSEPFFTTRTMPLFWAMRIRPSGRNAKAVGSVSPLANRSWVNPDGREITGEGAVSGAADATCGPSSASGRIPSSVFRRAVPSLSAVFASLVRRSSGGGWMGEGVRHAQPTSAVRASDSAAATSDRRAPLPSARARPFRASSSAIGLPSSVTGRYIRRRRPSKVTLGSSSKCTPPLTKARSSAVASLPQAVLPCGAWIPRIPTATRCPLIDTSRVSPSTTRTNPRTSTGPGPTASAPPGPIVSSELIIGESVGSGPRISVAS